MADSPVAQAGASSLAPSEPGGPFAASPEFYRTLIESLPHNIMQKDCQGRFTYVNARFCATVGRPAHEIVGKTDFDLYPAELAEKYRADDQRVMASGETFAIFETHQSTTGRTYIQVVKTPVVDVEGLVIGVQCVFWDGTERNVMEEQLHLERELLRAMLDTSPDSIYFKDEHSRFLKASRSLAECVGLSDPADLVGRTDADFFGIDHARQALLDERRIIEGGPPVIGQTERERRLDGRERWVTTTKMPLRDKAGRIVGTFGLSRDITELKHAEAAVEARTAELRRSLARYKVLVESTHAVPWELDGATFRFSYISPQAATVFGWDPDALLDGTSMLDLVFEEDRERVRDVLTELIRAQEGQNVALDFRIIGGDGRLGYTRSVLSVHREDPGQPGLVRGVTLDITEQKKLEAGLHQSQKLESIGRLAAGVAHEINTPVQFVSDSVHFVRDAMADLAGLVAQYRELTRSVLDGRATVEQAQQLVDAEDAADLAYVLENVPKALTRSLDGLDRVATIVRSMKEFAHPDQKEMTTVDINQAVQSTLVIARNEYKYVADVETAFGDLPLVTCHGGDVNQAILNIIVNAAHAIADVVADTPDRGRISVRTWQEGEMVCIAIADTGGGIPVAIHGRLFDPFFTTKEVGRGTGQGLAIARAIIVETHGGELTFDTDLGRGTTFLIRLPVVPANRKGVAA
jgi:two-component system NtrC family sensor kinase